MAYILKGNPQSTNHIYKTHGIYTYMTKAGKELKESYKTQLKEQGATLEHSQSLKIELWLYFMDKRIRDIDNYNKLVLDAGTGILWEDDKQIQTLIISKFYDKENPRIELKIL